MTPLAKKYSGPPRKTVRWPPLQLDTSKNKQMLDGEPTLILLRRFSNDKSLRGCWWNTCCGCGFRHMVTVNVFRDPDEDRYWLVERSFADEDTRPKRGKKAKR